MPGKNLLNDAQVDERIVRHPPPGVAHEREDKRRQDDDADAGDA
jgi:hypothetical protein